MEAVIYIRVSTDKQDYERQESDLSTYAKKFNIKVLRKFEEKISAFKTKLDERPEFQEMMEYVRDNNIKNILVTEISRLSRKYLETLNFVEDCNQAGICIHIAKEEITTLFNGRVNDTITRSLRYMSELAEDESKRIKARVNSGLQNRYKDGRGFNARVVGYKRDKDGRPIVDEEHRPIVKEIFRLYVEYRNLYKLANYANDKYPHIKRGKKKIGFTEGGLRSMLKNEIYIGKYKIAGYEHDIEPIIDKEQFAEVQEIMTNRKRASLDNKHVNPFAGLLWCGLCESIMHQAVSSDPKHRLNKYRCSNKKCDCKPVNRPHLIQRVRDILLTYNKGTGFEKQQKKANEKLEMLQSNKEAITKKINANIVRKGRLADEILDSKGSLKQTFKDKYEQNELTIKRDINRVATIDADINGIKQFLKGGEIKDNLNDLNILKDTVQKNLRAINIYSAYAEVILKGGIRYFTFIYRLGDLQRFNNGNLKDDEELLDNLYRDLDTEPYYRAIDKHLEAQQQASVSNKKETYKINVEKSADELLAELSYVKGEDGELIPTEEEVDYDVHKLIDEYGSAKVNEEFDSIEGEMANLTKEERRKYLYKLIDDLGYTSTTEPAKEKAIPTDRKATPKEMKSFLRPYIKETYGDEFTLPKLIPDDLVMWYELALKGKELPIEDNDNDAMPPTPDEEE